MSETFKSGLLRPVDLARDVGVSAQAVRNYEDEGLLLPARRGGNGYRRYTRVHLAALRAFAALVGAAGRARARQIMVAVNTGHPDRALEVLDLEHGQLLKDRRTLRTVEAALATLDRPLHAARSPAGPCSIGSLARRIGVTPAALRNWEREGVLSPRRSPGSGHRTYSQADQRDAELAFLLRRGGHSIAQVASFIDELRTAGSAAALHRGVHTWNCAVDRRARGLLEAAAALSHYLRCLGQGPGDGGSLARGGQSR